MDLHEDIGDLIKEKLHTVEKPFEKDSWPEIQDSLHKKRKKRRIVFFIKFGVLALLLTLIGFSILNETTLLPSNESKEIQSQEKIIVPDDSIKTSSNELSNRKAIINTDNDIEIEINRIKDSIETQIIKYNESNTDFSKTIQTPQRQIKKQKTKPVKLNVSKESLEKEKNSIPQASTTRKIYYYYNSKDGQEMSSMDKRVIDSVMRANEYKQDSIKIDY